MTETIDKLATHNKSGLHDLVRAVNLLRAPMLVCLLAAVTIIVPGQSLEIFRAVQESDNPMLEATLHIIAPAIVFSTIIFATCTLLLASTSERRQVAVDANRGLLESITIGLALLPILAVIAANIGAKATQAGPDALLAPTFWTVKLYLAAVIGISILAAGMSMWFTNTREWLIALGIWAFSGLQKIPAPRALAITAASIALITALFLFQPMAVPRAIGSIWVILLFFSSICITSSLMTFIYDQYQIPLLTALAVAAAAWSVTGINNNHQLPIVDRKASPAPEAGVAFEKWLEKRPDQEHYKKQGRPYPVYIVTADGGGLYAAVHLAWTLARIQDSCPAFASHIFAISSVSGGSLGSALFSALIKAYDPPASDKKNVETQPACLAQLTAPGKMQTAVKRYFQNDFLTPLLAAALFQDFFQRFWPYPIKSFDRANALEASFSVAWREIIAKDRPDLADLFNANVRSLWAPEGNSPALMLNTTQVSNGDRVIIAPFRLHNETRIFQNEYVDILNDSDVTTLAGAVSSSARFPIVTPPALHSIPSPTAPQPTLPWLPAKVWNFQLVDGGYFENSGMASAINLIQLLKFPNPDRLTLQPDTMTAKPGACPPNNLIITNSKSSANAACVKFITIRANIPDDDRVQTYGELISPVLGLYNTRIARELSALTLANALFCGGRDCGRGDAAINPHLYSDRIYIDYLRVPLGWRFSNMTLDKLLQPPSAPQNCFQATNDKPSDALRSIVTSRQESACLMPRIANDLK